MSQTFVVVVVVVGAGQAGGQLVTSLRSDGFDGQLILLGEEGYSPYQRPPLSKKFLAGEVELERVLFKPAEFYEKSEVDLRLNTQVTAINRAEHSLSLADGSQLNYDKLALAIGSRVRTLDIPGADLEGIHYLRTIKDMEAIKASFGSGKKLLIVGGGYIGLEVAAVAVKQGLQVTVLEMESRPMQRVVGPEMSTFYAGVHKEAGVDIRTETQVSGFEGVDKVEKVLCADGSQYDADVVVVGVGVMPNTELAAAADLAVDNGIVVDELCRTEDPDIVALGDCTNQPCQRYDQRLRLESVPNALAQARTAAATLCGASKPHNETPWFWSDQYDLKLQIVGLSAGYDQVVQRGDSAQNQFMLFYLKEGELIAVEAVNSMRDFMVCKQLVAAGAKIPPEKLADTSIAMKDLEK